MKNLKIIHTNSNSITISWGVTEIFVPLYNIKWYNELIGHSKSVKSNLSIYNITELEPCLIYTIRISKEDFKEDLKDEKEQEEKEKTLKGSTSPSGTF